VINGLVRTPPPVSSYNRTQHNVLLIFGLARSFLVSFCCLLLGCIPVNGWVTNGLVLMLPSVLKYDLVLCFLFFSWLVLSPPLIDVPFPSPFVLLLGCIPVNGVQRPGADAPPRYFSGSPRYPCVCILSTRWCLVSCSCLLYRLHSCEWVANGLVLMLPLGISRDHPGILVYVFSLPVGFLFRFPVSL